MRKRQICVERYLTLEIPDKHRTPYIIVRIR